MPRYSANDPLGILQVIIPDRKISEVSVKSGKGVTYLSNTIRSGSMPAIDTYAAILHTLGYELVVRGNGMEHIIAPPGSCKTLNLSKKDYEKILDALGASSFEDYLRRH